MKKLLEIYSRFIKSKFYFFYSKYSASFPIYIWIKRLTDNIPLCLILEILFFPGGGIYFYISLLIKKILPRVNNELWCICCIRNEKQYLKEWIEYYKLHNIDKIVFYDCSTDGSKEIIDPYIKQGFVKYHSNGVRRQTNAYNNSLFRYARRGRYFAFIDIDEFLRPLTCTTVKEEFFITFSQIKAKYPKLVGLNICWRFFGTSNIEKNSNDLVIKRFVYRANDDFGDNRLSKVIVDSSKAISFTNPHMPQVIYKYVFTDCDGNITTKPFLDKVCYSHLVNHHYFLKSKEEFFLKKNRGTASGRGKRLDSDLIRYDKNDVYDDSMLIYVDKINGV